MKKAGNMHGTIEHAEVVKLLDGWTIIPLWCSRLSFSFFFCCGSQNAGKTTPTELVDAIRPAGQPIWSRTSRCTKSVTQYNLRKTKANLCES
jgi:hypothetical protein